MQQMMSWPDIHGLAEVMDMRGVLNRSEYLRTARESAAFYNAWFLDTQEGGIYFNVLAFWVQPVMWLGAQAVKLIASPLTFFLT